jgi:lipopolysaccharide/colanic/teichoic acid biosynthesis glycosyltransferase
MTSHSNKLYVRILKPAIERVAAAVAIVLCAPILIALAIVVRIKLGSPVLFRQSRPGKDGCTFELCKFRTMTDARDAAGKLLDDVDRLTPFGKWLRSTSLDEVPELWNVLRGDMSLVGPRPLLTQYLKLYSPEQARRHCVKPGVTGLAQVSGRNALSWEQKFEFDLQYVDDISLWLDLKILAKTVLSVLRRDGINTASDSTMPVFSGTASDAKSTASKAA